MIGKIINYVKGKNEVIEEFHESARYLSAGTYAFDDSVKYITRMEPIIRQKASRVLHKSEYKKWMTRLFIYLLKRTLFRKGLTVSQGLLEKEFTGNVYLPVGSTNGYKDKKIFDLENNKILTVFSDRQAYQSVLENYKYFKDYFPMPSIICKNDQKALIIEELIFFHPVNQWKEEDFVFVMDDLFNRYLHYLKDCKIKGDYSSVTTTKLIEVLPDCQEVDFIKKQISPGLWDLEIPLVKLHGDLWTANTLLMKGEENQVLYIDWEFSKEYLFFYDFFNMMWLDVYMNERYFYINRFVSGDFDLPLEKVFTLFDLTFETKFRMEYFHLFFLNFYKERLVHFTETEKQAYFQQYKRLVEILMR